MAVVLVVDDEWAIAEFLRGLLEDEGHQVHVAHDGKAALAWALHTLPDLIITDIMMPIMDGLAFLAELARSASLYSLPIILMSAVPSQLAEGRPSNRTYYLPKPFRAVDLLAITADALAA